MAWVEMPRHSLGLCEYLKKTVGCHVSEKVLQLPHQIHRQYKTPIQYKYK